MNLTFSQFLEQRDPQLYAEILNEVTLKDAWQGMKNIWNRIFRKAEVDVQKMIKEKEQEQSMKTPDAILELIRTITRQYQPYWDSVRLQKWTANNPQGKKIKAAYEEAKGKKAVVTKLLDKLNEYMETPEGKVWGKKNRFRFTPEDIKNKTGLNIENVGGVIKKAMKLGFVAATIGVLLVSMAGNNEAPIYDDDDGDNSGLVAGGGGSGDTGVGAGGGGSGGGGAGGGGAGDTGVGVGGGGSGGGAGSGDVDQGDKTIRGREGRATPARDFLFGKKTAVDDQGNEINARHAPLRNFLLGKRPSQ